MGQGYEGIRPRDGRQAEIRASSVPVFKPRKGLKSIWAEGEETSCSQAYRGWYVLFLYQQFLVTSLRRIQPWWRSVQEWQGSLGALHPLNSISSATSSLHFCKQTSCL